MTGTEEGGLPNAPDAGIKRRPWLAALLAFMFPGLGHQYAGRGRAAVLIMFIEQFIEVAIVCAFFIYGSGLGAAVAPFLVVMTIRLAMALSAARAAKAFHSAKALPFYSRWYGLIAGFVLVNVMSTVTVSLVSGAVMQSFLMPTGSMEPTLLIGDRFTVSKLAYGWRNPFTGDAITKPRQPQRGDVVTFRFPENRTAIMVKRIIGLPGETISLRGRTITINGAPLDEPYTQFLFTPSDLDPPLDPEDEPDADATVVAGVDPGGRDASNYFGPVVVPEGSYFVLGDSRDNSRDSRFWGFVPADDVTGQVRLIYWSADEREGTFRFERIGRAVR